MKQGMLKPLLVGLVFALSWCPLGAQAQERIAENTITVQGTGAVTARPDSFQVTVGVESRGNTVEAARNQNAQRMTAVINRIKALGIPNLVLQTTGFSVYPIREPQPKDRNGGRMPDRIVGYEVRNQLNIKAEGADTDQLATAASRVVDTALAAGANIGGDIQFYLSRNSRAPMEALKLAVAQARQNAEAVAQAAGVRLTGVYTIEAYAQPIAMRSSMPMLAKGADMAETTPFEPGESDVTANVTVRYDFQD